MLQRFQEGFEKGLKSVWKVSRIGKVLKSFLKGPKKGFERGFEKGFEKGVY